MGNSETLSKPISHSKFPKLQLSESHMYITLNIMSESADLTPWLASQSHRSHIYTHPQSLTTEHIRTIHNGVCNDQCEAIFRSSQFPDTLHDELSKRSKISRHYSHEEIWYLFLMIGRLASHVYSHGSKWIIGNVHPRNIMINCEGEIKIVTRDSLPYERDHYQTYRREGLGYAYLSPELMGFTFKKEYGKFPQCINKHSSESFTIGVTILAMAMLLSDVSELYDTSFFFNFPSHLKNRSRELSNITEPSLQTSKIITVTAPHTLSGLLNQSYLNTLLQKIHRTYCPLLAIALKGLLHPDPSERISIETIYKEVLEANQGFILGMEVSWLGGKQLRQLTEEISEDEGEDEIPRSRIFHS